MRAYCDFDGTVTTVDTTDCVLARLASPEWETVEADWLAGKISAAECMRRQIALIQASDAQLHEVLDSVELTAGFPEFVRWCHDHHVPLTIVSDGVDYFIRRILDRHGLGHLPMRANHLSGNATARSLDQPWQRSDCESGSGVCKCSAVRAARSTQGWTPEHESHPLLTRQTTVFIGDGRSDFCVSGRVDLLFARDKLARHALETGMSFRPFSDFFEVLQVLSPVMEGAAGHARHERRLRAVS